MLIEAANAIFSDDTIKLACAFFMDGCLWSVVVNIATKKHVHTGLRRRCTGAWHPAVWTVHALDSKWTFFATQVTWLGAR